MIKKKTVLILLISVLSLLVIIPFGYIFVIAHISTTYPPIETYDLDMEIDEFASKLRCISEQNENFYFFAIDTVGDNSSGYRYYMEIIITDAINEISYNIAYEKKKFLFFKTNKTELDLISVYNKKPYRVFYKREKGINKVIKTFDKRVINLIQKQIDCP